MTVYERLMFLAKGGRVDYLHKKNENLKTTKLQNFLSEYMVRHDLNA
ncbi:hypothetical protein [Bacillus sp. M6-12]|nr:hypothetical protein [Bacillus sp. M6-12]